MRSLWAWAGLCAMAVTAANAAEPTGVKFWGYVEKDDAHIVSYYLTVPPGESATLEMKNGFRLEMVAASTTAGAESEIKVYDERGKLLHERTVPGPAPANVSGAYSLCRGSLAFISPAPSEPSGCED